MSESKVYSFMGLARKAGRLVAGDALVEQTVRKRKARLVILTEDAAERTKTGIRAVCETSHVEVVEFGEKAELGALLGRDAYAVAAITDEGFAVRLKVLIQDAMQQRNTKHGGGLI